jgi:phenylacetaldehyde dehydrogenase
MSTMSWKLGPALACGNTVVLKPAEQTPLTALRLGELAIEAGFPAGVLNIVTGDGETGKAVVRHPDVNKIAFTGSTAVGQEIMRVAADDMKRVTLELGGKSPNVVLADADLDAAIAGAALGIFYDSGEVCTAGSRILVQEEILDQVVEGIQVQAEGMKIGHGLDADSDLGPLISAAHRERVSGFVRGAQDEGVKVAFGGESRPGDGYFFEPTVLLDAAPDTRVAREEIFGPVATLTPFSDIDEAVAIANNTSFGLGAGIWTRDLSKAHQFAARVEAGTVWVNCYNLADPALPFGGYKQSGVGRELGADTVREFTETKTVLVQLG